MTSGSQPMTSLARPPFQTQAPAATSIAPSARQGGATAMLPCSDTPFTAAFGGDTDEGPSAHAGAEGLRHRDRAARMEPHDDAGHRAPPVEDADHGPIRQDGAGSHLERARADARDRIVRIEVLGACLGRQGREGGHREEHRRHPSVHDASVPPEASVSGLPRDPDGGPPETLCRRESSYKADSGRPSALRPPPEG